jgi:hypothetical protein
LLLQNSNGKSTNSLLITLGSYELERFGATQIPHERERSHPKNVWEPYTHKKRAEEQPVRRSTAQYLDPPSAEERYTNEPNENRQKNRPSQVSATPRHGSRGKTIDNIDYQYRKRAPSEATIDNSAYSPSVEEVNNDGSACIRKKKKRPSVRTV